MDLVLHVPWAALPGLGLPGHAEVRSAGERRFSVAPYDQVEIVSAGRKGRDVERRQGLHASCRGRRARATRPHGAARVEHQGPPVPAPSIVRAASDESDLELGGKQAAEPLRVGQQPGAAAVTFDAAERPRPWFAHLGPNEPGMGQLDSIRRVRDLELALDLGRFGDPAPHEHQPALARQEILDLHLQPVGRRRGRESQEHHAAEPRARGERIHRELLHRLVLPGTVAIGQSSPEPHPPATQGIPVQGGQRGGRQADVDLERPVRAVGEGRGVHREAHVALDPPGQRPRTFLAVRARGERRRDHQKRPARPLAGARSIPSTFRHGG